MQLQHAQADFGETDFYRAGGLCRKEYFRCKKNAAGCLKLKQSNTSAGGPRRALNLSAELYPIMTHKSIHVVYRCAAAS